jgi:hypothetical protein
VNDGLLHIEFGRAERDLLLSDGAEVKRDDLVIELHLWNEHFPGFPSGDADFGWTDRAQQQLLSSVHRLAFYIRKDPKRDRTQALGMKLSIAKQQPENVLARLLLNAGLVPIGQASPRMECVLRFLDGVWAWLLTWTYNFRALIGWRFNRTRREFSISRAKFIALYESLRVARSRQL